MADSRQQFVETFVGAVQACLAKAPPGAPALEPADQAALADGLRKVDGSERELAIGALVKMIEQLHAAKHDAAATQLMGLLQLLQR